MADNSKDPKTTEPPQQIDIKKGFGSFKIMLADILTFATVIRLATLFEYPPRIIEELEKKENRSHVMIRHMEERGQIKPDDITLLLDGLKKLDLTGTESKVGELFEEQTGLRCTDDKNLLQQKGKGKLGKFLDFLRTIYALWYNKIQPIPYIRERVYCVNDVYVEGGVKVVQSLKSSWRGPEESSSEELKSFSDIFDTNKISTNRILLEGDPGYGKSTLTLQAAYEWCSGRESSPLKMFEVFILLPLRLLGNITSIYEGIRLLLMPREANLTDDDIKEILTSCSVGVIVLDGYDEYPEKDSDSDVIKIIEGTMFSKFKVVLTSRSLSLPRILDPRTVTIRLTGFDDKSLYKYIKQAVTGGNEEEATKIKDILNSSPVLADICQIPIFCVLFAHTTKEQSHSVARFSSVTSFFGYIISCFYSHMRNKGSKTAPNDTIPDYKSLNKLAFESLVGKSQHLNWSKKTFIETVGSNCYKELLNIGILIEETILIIKDEPGTDINNRIKYQTLIRFYHKLFAEWYAGNYLSSCAGGFWPIRLNYTLDKINPVDLQYVFRFASGLNKKACERIVKYLERLEGGKTFASLCLFEQSTDQSILEEMVKDLLSDTVIIKETDSKLLQRSNIQLLDVASRNDIPISKLSLVWSFRGFDGDNIRLESGLCISSLSSVEKISINGGGEITLSEGEVTGLLNFGIKSRRFQGLWFDNCKLPPSINPASIPEEAKSRNAKVFSSNDALSFNLETGEWTEPQDIETIKTMCSGGLTINNRTSESAQRSVIELLVKGTNHDIPIFQVDLILSFDKIDEDGLNIILKSGLLLPNISSMERMMIQTERGREMKEEEVNGILNYLQQNKRLKILSLMSCVLPSRIRLGPAAFTLRYRNVKVFWIPDSNKHHQRYLLELTRGHWDKYGAEAASSSSALPGSPSQTKTKRRNGSELSASLQPQFITPANLSPESDQDRALTVKMLVDKNGGVLSISGTGVRLKIPQGAMLEEQLISMRIVTSYYQDQSSLTFTSNSSTVVELLPNNQELLKPALLTLPHCLVLKKDVEWKAKIYSSHHKEGERPLWIEQPETNYELNEKDSMIYLQSFSWKRIKIGSKYVEGKKIMMYAAKCPDWTCLHIGFFLDLPGGEKVTDVKKNDFLHTKRSVVVQEGEKPLQISFKRTTSSNWHHDSKDDNPKNIPFKTLAFSDESFCTFVFIENDDIEENSNSKCFFELGQTPDLEDFIFPRKVCGTSTLVADASNSSEVTSLSSLTKKKRRKKKNVEKCESSASLQDAVSLSVRSTELLPQGNASESSAILKVAKLDLPIDDETLMLQELPKKIGYCWRDIGKNMGFEDGELDQIAMDNANNVRQAIHTMLRHWKQKNGKDATFRALGTSFYKADRKDLQDTVYERAFQNL